MAALRSLLVSLIMASSFSVTSQEFSTTVTNVSTILTWEFADLMQRVCGQYCPRGRVYKMNCEPQVCLDCRCDSNCFLYGDCCPHPKSHFSLPSVSKVRSTTETSAPTELPIGPVTNSVAVDEDTTPPSSLEVEWYTDTRSSKFDCVVSKPGIYTMDLLRDDQGVFMLRKCRPGFDDANVKRLCESDVRLYTPMPVSSLESEHTFFNQFCAICNGETALSYWDRSSRNDVPLLRLPLTVGVRTCDRRRSLEVEMTTCNATGLWQEYNADLEARCRSLYYPVSYRGRIFQNYYCLMCNGGLSAGINCQITRRLGPMVGIDAGPWFVVGQEDVLFIGKSDVNTLVNFLPNTERSAYTPRIECRRRPACEEGFWLDPFREICRKLQCNAGRQLVNGSCVLSSPETQSTQYRATLLLTPSINTSLANLTNLIEENYDYFSSGFLSDNIKVVISEVQPNLSENAFIMDARFLLKGGETGDVERHLVKFVNSEWKFFLRGVNQTISSKIVESQDWLTSVLSSPLSLASIPGSNKFFPVSEHFEIIDFKGFTVVSSTGFVNLTQHMTCPYVYIHDHGFNSTHMVDVLYEDARFDVTRVTLRDHYLLVCVDTLESIYHEAHPEEVSEESVGEREVSMEARVRAGLSIFCTALSLVCLFLTICTYCAFPVLRSQPGWNNLMLAVALFSAQLTLMFASLSSASPLGCRVYGVVLHFFWLAAVMWMNVCSFHMFRTFSSTLRLATDSVSFKLLAKYFFYAFGVPSAIVLVTMVTSIGLSGGSEIGYGGQSCYLSTHLLVGLAFALPLVLVLVSNLVFFIVTVRSINATKQLHRDVDNERTNVYVYVKLSSLTGLFWTVALLAEVTNVQSLALLSVILNSSQGVFIFFSFIFNKKVFRLWCSRARKPSSSGSSSYLGNGQNTNSSKV